LNQTQSRLKLIHDRTGETSAIADVIT